MPQPDPSNATQPDVPPRFLRRFAGAMRLAVLGTAIFVAPLLVIAPFAFASDGRYGWTAFFGIFACLVIAFLVLAPLLGYRIDRDGIASREGIPPRFTTTTRWDDVRLITWHAAPIRGTADNCTIWATEGGHRSKRLRWLLEAQVVPSSMAVVRRHQAMHGELQPLFITLSHLSKRNREHLFAAFERQGFRPLPTERSQYGATISSPTAQ